MIKEISAAELQELLQNGATLVDVREPEELKDGALADSQHWPLSTFGKHCEEISRNKPTIFYCRSGLRSMKAAEIASTWTPQAIYSLKGGYLGWISPKS